MYLSLSHIYTYIIKRYTVTYTNNISYIKDLRVYHDAYHRRNIVTPLKYNENVEHLRSMLAQIRT